MVWVAHGKKINFKSKALCDQCAKHGYTKLVFWFRGLGCVLDEETARNAAIGGRLETLKSAQKNAVGTDLSALQLLKTVTLRP